MKQAELQVIRDRSSLHIKSFFPSWFFLHWYGLLIYDRPYLGRNRKEIKDDVFSKQAHVHMRCAFVLIGLLIIVILLIGWLLGNLLRDYKRILKLGT